MAVICPSHYTEATMIKMMAKNAIGTEATRVGAINSLTRDGVAEALPVPGASMELRATAWAEELFAKLPGEVTGPSMGDLIKLAQDEARKGMVDLDRFLLDATKFIIKMSSIPQKFAL